jgi:hypothetical protein
MYMPDLLGMLFASGPSRLRLRAPWSLHQTLAALDTAARKADMGDSLPIMTFRPDANVGMVEEGVVEAVHELMAAGVLQIVGEGWDAAIEVSYETRLRPYRRILMGLEPELAELVYRAGNSWAALSFTAEKNWDRARRSVAARRTSVTPKRRHGPAAAVR